MRGLLPALGGAAIAALLSASAMAGSSSVPMLVSRAQPTASPSSMSPLSATVDDNLAASAEIAMVNVTMSDSSTFNGTCASTDSTYTHVVAVSGGCQLNVRSGSGYGSGDDGTHTFSLSATENGHTLSGQSFSLRINSSSSSNYGNYLLGCLGCQSAWTTYTGLSASQIVGCGNMSAIQDSGSSPTACGGTAMYVSLQAFDDPSQASAAAAGTYNSDYDATLQNDYDPVASNIMYIRVNSEWQGCWNTYSPFYTGCDESSPNISASTYVAAAQQLISRIKADTHLSHAKIAFDAPQNSVEDNYYYGDSYVDMLTWDIYFGLGGGSTPEASWSTYSPALDTMDSFATAHGLAEAIPEWCQFFSSSNDGYDITQMANWFNSHNVVDNNYWDQDYAVVDTDGSHCTIDESSAKVTAYTNAFSGYSYTGSYFPSAGHW